MAGTAIRGFFSRKVFHFLKTKAAFHHLRDVSTKGTTAIQQKLKLKVRYLTEEDIPQFIEFRKAYTFHDAKSGYSIYMKINPECIVITTDEHGKIIGSCSASINNEDLCTGGMLTMHEDYRKMNIPMTLMYSTYFKVVGNRILVANSELHRHDWNMKNIFTAMEKDFVCFDYECGHKVNPDNLSTYIPQNVNIEEFQDSHLVSILDYDEKIMGYKREMAVTLNCRDQYSRTLIASRNNKCVGYGTLKLDIQGWSKLGPLYADDPEIAEALLRKLLILFNFGDGFATTSVSNNAEAIKLIHKLCDVKTFINYRYYRNAKTLSNPGTHNIYGILDMEFEPF